MDGPEIIDVWADNFEYEMRRFGFHIVNYPVVALDTEFPGFTSTAGLTELIEVMYDNVADTKIIQLGMAVELRVLTGGKAAHLWDGGESNAHALNLLGWFGMLDDGHHGRAETAEARMLKRLGLEPACDHQPAMGVRCHLVGCSGFVEQRFDVLARKAGVQRNSLERVEQPVHMFIEEGPNAVVQAHSFPHPIAQHEPGIEHRNHGSISGYELAVHVDEHVLVSWVFVVIVGAVSHRAIVGAEFRSTADIVGR